MSRFWIFQDCHYAQASEFSGWHRFAYFSKYGMVLSSVEMQWRKASKYSRIPNIPGFCRCKLYTRCWIAWIWLNSAWINCSDYEYAWSNLHRVLNMAPALNTLSVKKKKKKNEKWPIFSGDQYISLLFFLLNKKQMTEILKKKFLYTIIWLSGVG